MTPIIFPDVELTLTGYLRTALAAHGYPGMFVSNRRESQTSAVWVRRDGGPTGLVTSDARVGVNVFAPTEQAATDLANVVSALLRAAPGTGAIKRVRETGGPSAVADTTPRRFMTYEVRVIGSALTS